MASAVHADLVDRLGRARVLMGEDARRACGLEAGAPGPLAVARPVTVEQVEHIVKVGKLRHAPIHARSRFPVRQPDEVRDVIVLDVTGLQRPPAIDIGRRTVTVGVGIDTSQIDRVARQARLCLRAVPSLDDGEKIGALLLRGDPGELGFGDGPLLDDLVSALVVTGGGRVLQLGAADVIGLPSWLGQGVAHPLGALLGSEGRLGIVCEVTLRLHPSPHVAWTGADLPPDRDGVLQAASWLRGVLSSRLADTVLIHEQPQGVHLDLRLATWRSEEDLPVVAHQVRERAAQAGVRLKPIQLEPRRVRLGLQLGPWPRQEEASPALDLRLSWPDLPGLLDLTSALYAEAGQSPDRTWALGADSVRVRCRLGSLRLELHPLVTRSHLLMDAGAVPVAFGSLLRAAGRDRMPTPAKVLLTALQRAWDPEGVLSVRTGIL